MRHIAGDRAIGRSVASTSLMGRLEIEKPTQPGVWYHKVDGEELGKMGELDLAPRKTNSPQTIYWFFGWGRSGTIYAGLRLVEIIHLGELESMMISD